ncbi:MAG TPA: transcription antitermination factor NusB, partial [Prochlorococcus sp.]
MTASASVTAPGAPAPGLLPRRVAWEVLQAVSAGAYADIALERALRQHPMSGADRSLVTELTYGAIRQRQWLDAWLDRLGKVPASKQPPLLRWLLHLGLYQILRMDRIPAAA